MNGGMDREGQICGETERNKRKKRKGQGSDETKSDRDRVGLKETEAEMKE